MYQLTKYGVRRLSDNAHIPNDEGNRDWIEYQQWLADGNEPEPVPVPEPSIPSVVTMRQARLALLGAGILDDVETALAAMEGDAGKAALIEWDYSSEVHRHKPFVQGIGALLGLTEEAIDQLFITAASIQ